MFNKEYVTKDTESIKDNNLLPDLLYAKLTSRDSDLYGLILKPQGKGPHPTAILLHGFPGYDDPLDLGHALRRCGMNVLRFHYRGSWGVKGDFSFKHCMEDVKAAIDYLTDEETVKELDIDTKNLFLIGHSMGGFLALTHATDKRIKATVAISPYDFGLVGKVGYEDKKERDEGFEMFETALSPLNNTSAEKLMKECLDNRLEYNLVDKADKLADEKLLILAANQDIVSKKYLHNDILVKEIKKYNKNNLVEIYTDTDHSYSNKRIWLAKTIANYLEGIINNNL